MPRPPIALSRADAAAFLVSHLGVDGDARASGTAGIRSVLGALRCIQIDPLDPMGTNADLVALARVRGAERGDVYSSVLPGHGFEHFAKERCLLPADAFPYYRDRAVETPWWRTTERQKRIPAALCDEVLAEVRARGPISAADLEHRGTVKPLDWSGWKGTSSASTMALEILWTRCQVVVADRRGGKKRYDVPDRALPHVHGKKTTETFERWALAERVRSAGLLSTASSPSWSMLRDAKKTTLIADAIEAGSIADVVVEGLSRRFLAPPELARPRRARAPDDRMRILGPLDPLLWDRALVHHVFGFEYLWEVYKPAAQRRWGWYVHPLLHRGRLVGRLEGRLTDAATGTGSKARSGSKARGGSNRQPSRVLSIDRVWRETPDFDEAALDTALERHAQACGAASVRRGPRARRR